MHASSINGLRPKVFWEGKNAFAGAGRSDDAAQRAESWPRVLSPRWQTLGQMRNIINFLMAPKKTQTCFGRKSYYGLARVRNSVTFIFNSEMFKATAALLFGSFMAMQAEALKIDV